ncbi:MAG: NAD(P)-dependent oxidoreductase [Burkholderiaceae bacterium]
MNLPARPLVLVTHPQGRLADYFGEQALRQLGAVAQVRLNPFNTDLSGQELIDAAQGCVAIIAYRQTPLGAPVFAALASLQAVVRCAVDIRTIDVDAASRHGVLVTQASAGFMASVSEWVIGVMIDQSRHITSAAATYHAGIEAQPRMGRELRGATLGVIGYGQISRYLCLLALALGMRVVVTDPHARVSEAGIEQTGMTELLAVADFVVCLAPANASTENLLGEPAFAAMKPGAFFINAARGNLVDEDALLHALESGHLGGAAVDVGRAVDQMPSLALARHARVIATPHIGGLTPPAIEHQALETVAQTSEILRGRIPNGAVNAHSATRLRASARA